MILFLLHMASQHSGIDDRTTRVAGQIYEAAKKNDMSLLNRESMDKQSPVTLSEDTLARAIRELYN